ncbi:MAG: MltA domain-containing protein [Paracoccaceae bacterium]|nr:MltA domain-containing protein [Paracoccaceae bacterium]
MIRAAALAAAFAAMTAGGAAAEAQYSFLEWDDLDGWSADSHDVALSVFSETCGDLEGPHWPAICAVAKSDPPAREFFERLFLPVMIEDGEAPLFTGYFEPELAGSLVRTTTFRYPLYRRPPELPSQPWLTRREIETTGILDGRDLEIAWLSDPVDKFFLQVQGSGRIRLPDGRGIRVGFGGKNGHPYRSIGNEMVRRGYLPEHQVSAPMIRRWVADNPVAGAELLHHNPSYVFFREVTRVPPNRGPLGAMNRSITAGRSVAIDPEFVPLGAPVWLEKGGEEPLRRLMVAQDTGSAVKGAQRADIFFGTGDEAGEVAGRVRDSGRLVVLLPVDTALDLAAQ